ncbi:MAG: hypothetical protein N2257_07910 [Thermodesulfovibrionales bacterium]|nr:hypothetical protein [Thermodesulfovibrionales bacterium]
MNIHDVRSRIQNYGRIVLLLFLIIAFNLSIVTASEKWSGVDESVIERFAKEHGREAGDPLINTDQGDLLLFVFLIAGAVGGFFAGYYWMVLSEERGPQSR